MINNLKNIISKAATDCSGSVDRWYYSYVPQGTLLPYVSYFLITETYNGKDSLNLYGDVILQFNIYSKYQDYGEQCNTILQEILNYFDNEFLTYANASGSVEVISCNRDFTRPANWISTNWQATTQYRIHILN